jgi:hypothetical protein
MAPRLGDAEAEVAGSDKKVGRSGAQAGYEPIRAPKLRAVEVDPPPIPAPATIGSGFGSGDEDGLYMLAALETLTSLEPDYSDDLAAEASVTIIEAADADVVTAALDASPLRRPRAAAPARSDKALLLNGYETFLGAGDEATIEIVETAPAPREPAESDAEAAPEPESATKTATQPASLTERLAAAAGPGGRFFRALSGN